MVKPIIYVAGTELPCRLAMTGIGIAAIPLPLASDRLAQNCLVRVLPELPAGNVPFKRFMPHVASSHRKSGCSLMRARMKWRVMGGAKDSGDNVAIEDIGGV